MPERDTGRETPPRHKSLFKMQTFTGSQKRRQEKSNVLLSCTNLFKVGIETHRLTDILGARLLMPIATYMLNVTQNSTERHAFQINPSYTT